MVDFSLNYTTIKIELFDFLKFNKKEKGYLFNCISKQVFNYRFKDNGEDIVQIICEGLLLEINKKASLEEFDQITKNILNNDKQLKINITKNRFLIKNINREYQILKLKREIRFLGKKISNITSDAYGIRRRKKRDFFNSDNSEVGIRKTRLIDEEEDGYSLFDKDADFDIKSKYVINNYYEKLDNTEKVMFDKLYYEGVSYKGMLELDEVKSDYSLRIFVKKTKQHFKEQLLD